MAKATTPAEQLSKETAVLGKAGLPPGVVKSWLRARPGIRGDFRADAAACAKFWRMSAKLRAQLPAKAGRNADQSAACDLIFERERRLRERFLSAHAQKLYDKLTDKRRAFVRAERLVFDAADLVPGLAPTSKQLRPERALALKDKEGLEIDQGILLSHILADPETGRHLCHAMLRPRPESGELLARFKKDGAADLGAAAINRQGKAAIVELRNTRFLNALDDSTVVPLEIATDIAILDRDTEIAVLRGSPVQHPKYAGRRIFCSGLNLTHLYQGKISYLFYVLHLMGYEHKMHRGLARPDASPDDLAAATIEKPWIAAVDTFAIGGGCQHLLVMDYVLAATDAYLMLPARKEGIIPGAANLRLPRFVGDRIARQAIMYGRALPCDSPEGRLVCDDVVPPEEMDTALARVIEGLTSSGIVSAVGNRRQFRIGQEPLDLFRRYLALYVREQAYCHFSQGLISNLERYWNAQVRAA